MFPPKGIISANVEDINAVRVITTSGRYYATAENFKLSVAGGGCGGAAGSFGGASAGQAVKVFRNIAIGTPIDIIIGALGLGGINGGAARTAGGDTTVTVRAQTPIVCQGGQTTNVGGTATGGDINIAGQRPMLPYYNGSATDTTGGDGGNTIFGQGGRCTGAPSDASGQPGTGYGSGGSGGTFVSGSGTSHTAGNGAVGVCIIENLRS